jgi:nucleoside-diphosphate-sugar epimerase
MMRWLKRGLPLPLGAITHNRRSMVALGNLVDLITVCLSHPAAANQVFLVSDGDDLSTADLLQRTAAALGVKAKLFLMPPIMLKWATKILGQEAIYQRLCGSLQIDTDDLSVVSAYAEAGKRILFKTVALGSR